MMKIPLFTPRNISANHANATKNCAVHKIRIVVTDASQILTKMPCAFTSS